MLECLSETHEDRVNDQDAGTESVALVPVAPPATKAMDDHRFLNFIRKSGLAPPASEQERYWRIPSTLATKTLQSRIDFMKSAMDGARPDAATLPVAAASNNSNNNKRSSVKFTAEEGNGEEGSPSATAARFTKRRRIIADDSSDEEEARPTAAAAAASDEADTSKTTAHLTPSVAKRRAAVFASDSE